MSRFARRQPICLGLSELCFNHIWMLPQYVVAGELDRLLTYPVHTLSFFLVTRPELHAFGNLFTGGVFALEARRGLTGAGARGSRKVLGVMSDRAEEGVRR